MIPKKIKILGHEYKVILNDDYITESGGNTRPYNSYTNKIHICGKLPESAQHEVLMHEIIEALNYQIKLEVINNG